MPRWEALDGEMALKGPPMFKSEIKKPPRRAPTPFLGDWKVGGRLELKVGKVIHVEDHIWDKNRFHFEYIEAGDRVSQVFVRGIRKFFDKDDFENMRVVLLYIALPHWWNCQESRLLSVLSARTRKKVEMLEPPAAAEIGDDIVVDKHINSWPRRRPYLQFYQHERRLQQVVTPDFWVNEEGNVTYAGRPVYVPGKGNVTAKTLRNCRVK